MKTGLYS